MYFLAFFFAIFLAFFAYFFLLCDEYLGVLPLSLPLEWLNVLRLRLEERANRLLLISSASAMPSAL